MSIFNECLTLNRDDFSPLISIFMVSIISRIFEKNYLVLGLTEPLLANLFTF